MNNELIFIPLATLVLGGVGGYYMGRYQAALIDKIHKLEQTPAVEVKPIITMGAYDTLQVLATVIRLSVLLNQRHRN